MNNSINPKAESNVAHSSRENVKTISMKALILFGLFIFIGGIVPGCTHWEISRSFHNLGSDKHHIRLNFVPVFSPGVIEANYIRIYEYGNSFYHIPEKTVCAARHPGLVDGLVASVSSLEEIINKDNITSTDEYYEKYYSEHPKLYCVWQPILLDDIKLSLIKNSNIVDIFCVATYVNNTYQKKYFSINCHSDNVSYNKIPEKSHGSLDVKNGKLSIYILQFSDIRWTVHDVTLQIIKLPFYSLTAIADILTGPMQTAWDGYRMGP